MKVAVIGTTGFVGNAITKELISRSINVTGVARSDKNKIERVNYIFVDILDTAKLAEALKGNDVLVSAFNPGWSNPNIYNDFMAGMESIQKAVKISGIKRFIVIGGAGSMYNEDGKQLVDSEDFPAEIKEGAKAARDYLNVIKKEKDLDWVFFSPAIEMHPGIETGRTGKYRLGKDHPIFNAEGRSLLSVEDLAVVIADELVSPKHHQERFTAGY